MDRRTFLGTLAGALLAAPLAAEAQQVGKRRLIGYLVTSSVEAPEGRLLYDAFRRGLRELGYVEGQDIVIERRWAEGHVEWFPRLAIELVRLKPEVIVAANTLAARAVRDATTTIPIVSPVMGDPVGDGLVASLARPAGNVTGMTFLAPELSTKRLELLKETLPRVSRVAGLWHPSAFSERTAKEMLGGTKAAAETLKVHLSLLAARRAGDIEGAFAAMTKERADALLVFPSPMLFTERKRIVELAGQRRLPLMAVAREFVELGGLIAYGASIPDLFYRAAAYVDKILNGAKPADLPVQQPTKFDLVINLKTAKALGLTIPQSLLLRADQVIE